MFDSFINNHNSYEVDAERRRQTERIWNKLNYEQKKVLTKYTETYSYLNEPLRVIQYLGPTTGFKEDFETLTDALSTHKTKQPIIVRRGTENFKTTYGKYLNELKVGDEFIEGGFLSTSIDIDHGFKETYEFIIYVPKGAEGIYAEPFSHYTDAGKYTYGSWENPTNLWDGQEKCSFGDEREWIGQRGAKFQVIKTEGRRIYLKMISQKNMVKGIKLP